MFIYLSKKVAIPNGVKLKCLSWNSEQGWIACGGDNGLLKVLKLDSVGRKDSKGSTAASSSTSNLSMNQTLEGHNGAVLVTCWNENYRKLTTSDQKGLIIVWMLHKGMWFEEMINNRNKSIVRDMQWTADGQKICIVYEDGAVIVGSVDGNRLWGKEMELQLALVEWSPDGRLILFCTLQGECHVHDNNGNPLTKLPLCVPDQPPGSVPIIGLDWYHGLEGYADPNAPTLALAFENGKIQLMRHEADEEPVLVDTRMRASRIAWNSNGTVLAVSGTLPGTSDGKGAPEAKETPAVHFYSNQGALLRTLRVPGSGIASLSWEGGGLRVALAVDSFIYFANVRPDYKWGYFNQTCVYAHVKADRSEHCVTFWDTGSNEKYCKYVKRLLGIRAAGDHCVLAANGDDAGQFVVVLCDAIGSPLETRYIDVEPLFVTMTQTHLAVASEEWVWVWHYRAAQKGVNTTGDMNGTLGSKTTKEWKLRIDDVVARRSSSALEGSQMELAAPSKTIEDRITCLCASEKYLLVGRASGSVHHYTLTLVALENKYTLRCKPQAMALNSDSTRISVVDINGVLTLYDFDAKEDGAGTTARLVADFERKDVWDMRWADDNPELLAVMEKAKMYIFRGTDPEEPVNSNGYLCSFSNLEIKAVSLEDVMRRPDAPEGAHLLNLETKSLRDLRAILADASLADSYQFVEEHSHPRLWKLLAEHALEKRDWAVAEKAFVRYQDYYGIQFVKRLQLLDEKEKQQAEVAVYFKRFDEAERLYERMDRPDLAIELRMKLGDWFKVEKLLQAGGGDDSQLTTAWNRIGDYYADRQKWAKAAQYYAQAKNSEQLVECFYVLENWAGLERLIGTLPEGSALLSVIGERFASVGICEHATTAFLRAGDVTAAIECCVALNQWDRAVRLAEQQRSGHIEALLAKYANHLLEKGKQLQAIELYRRADHHSDAARLLSALARDAAAAKASPQRVKKLYVLAALEAEEFRKKTLSLQGSSGVTKSVAAATLEGLIQHDQATGLDKSLASAWHGAEGWHLWLLAHRQLYAGSTDAAMKTALRLQEYEDVLNPVHVSSLVALTAFYNRHYQQCSQAFIRLESHPDLSTSKQEAYAYLALSIFVQSEPEDPPGRAQSCSLCRGPVQDWSSRCPANGCEATFPVCVASGRSIISDDRVKCRTCKHLMIPSELGTLQSCPLCHAALDENKQRTSSQNMYKKMR